MPQFMAFTPPMAPQVLIVNGDPRPDIVGIRVASVADADADAFPYKKPLQQPPPAWDVEFKLDTGETFTIRQTGGDFCTLTDDEVRLTIDQMPPRGVGI